MKAQNKNEALVRRITVDEKLYDDLIRLEICDLVPGVDRFEDCAECWIDTNEEEGRVTRDNFAEVMGIPKAQSNQWQWKDLEEGQVFLSGSFKEGSAKNYPGTFVVEPGKHEFVRIDNMVRKEIKNIYYEVLSRKK